MKLDILRALGATDADLGMLRAAAELAREHARRHGWLATAVALVRGKR
jgi:hypothetical protein